MRSSIYEEGDMDLAALKASIPIVEVIEALGLRVKDEAVFCPFHDDQNTPNLKLNGERFKCFACGESGDALDLVGKVRDIGVKEAARWLADTFNKTVEYAEEAHTFVSHSPEEVEAYTEALFKDRAALDYLMSERGMTEKTLRHFRIGLKQDDTKWITIPHVKDRRVVNLKHRRLEPGEPKYKRTKGAETVLFNVDSLDVSKPVIITEGEIDAMTLWDRGFRNVCAVTAGAQAGFRWGEALEGVKSIYLLYDMDEPGRRGAESVARQLGMDRTHNVVLPRGKDVNEYFAKCEGTPEELRDVLNNTKPTPIEHVVSLKDAGEQFMERMRSGGLRRTGLETPWTRVNDIMGPMCPEDLVVVVAPAKIGKTTFALQTAFFLAAQDHGVLFYCLEMSTDKLLRKTLCMREQKRWEEFSLVEAEEALQEIARRPFYFAHRADCFDSEEERGREDRVGVVQKIQEVHRRYGVEFVVFDNLQWLCRKETGITERTNVVSKGMKDLASELGIVIMLISQPTKLGGRIATAEDVYFSGVVQADADTVIVLHRERVAERKEKDMEIRDLKDIRSPTMLVRVDASREAPGGQTHLMFEGALSHLRHMTPEEVENHEIPF